MTNLEQEIAKNENGNRYKELTRSRKVRKVRNGKMNRNINRKLNLHAKYIYSRLDKL